MTGCRCAGTAPARTGSRKAQVRWRRGTVRHCAAPRTRDAATRDADALVVESRFGERSVFLYVTRSDRELSTLLTESPWRFPGGLKIFFRPHLLWFGEKSG